MPNYTAQQVMEVPYKHMYFGPMLALPFYHWASTDPTLDQPIVFTGLLVVTMYVSESNGT